jgi:hypothetical protein
MFSYALLEPECYYLIEEKPEEGVTLIQVKVVSDTSMFITKFGETVQMEWRKKSDDIHDILELLSDDVAKQWLKVYYNNEDAYYEGDDE